MTSETRTRKEEAKAEAITYLRELLPPGSTASTILRHVAPSATLYPDGFDCIGEGNGEHGTGCPSNDHSNDHYDGPPASERYAPTRRHRSGGYAVSQRWL
jgi:hypothetical protein